MASMIQSNAMTDPIEQTIRYLAGGKRVHDSQELRAALDDLGLDFRESGGELLLTQPVELLDQTYLRERLDDVSLEVLWSVGSTNTHVMTFKKAASVAHVCLSERQIQGKGRRGRTWVSPFGTNIYVSIGRRFRRSLAELGGLSIAIGISIADSLRRLGAKDVGVKWPNDILMGGGKLAGILIELGPQEQGSTFVVTGVGINLGLTDKDTKDIEQPWSTLGGVVGVSRNELASVVIKDLLNTLAEFDENGFARFYQAWPEFNVYQGAEVDIVFGNERLSGVDAGIDESGALRVRLGDSVKVFNAGEISVRRLGAASS